MKSKLFFKIFATYLLMIALVMGVTEFVLTPTIRDTITKETVDRMAGQVRLLAMIHLPELKERLPALSSMTDLRITLIDARGRVLEDSSSEEEGLDNHLNRSEIQEARLRDLGTAMRYSSTLEENMLYVAVPMWENKKIQGYVRVARPMTAVRQSIEHLYDSIYLVLFIVTVPALLLAFLFSRGITGNVRRLVTFTTAIRNGDTPGPLLLETQDDLETLATNINAILEMQQERLRQAVEEKSKLDAAFTAMAEGVLVLDRDGRIETINTSLANLLGKPLETVAGKTLMEAFRNPELQDALQRFRQTGQPVHEEIVLGDNGALTLDINITAVRYREDVEKTMLVFHDVTRLKQLERIRTDFIANLTHELKTPLTAIIGYVETLKQGITDDPAIQERFLRIIHDAACRLDRLVEDLVILSSLEKGQVPFTRTHVPVREVLEDRVLPLIQPKAREKGLEVIVRLPQDYPALYADQDQLEQIFVNLLDNAVKFTSVGEITVSGSTELRPGFVSLSVTDTGIGIPATDLPRLGERFYRVDRTRSRELGGTGLGLSIARRIMKAHQGFMDISSTVGHGTTVTLHFPISQNSATP